MCNNEVHTLPQYVCRGKLLWCIYNTVGPQEFSDSMTPDQLYSWLLSNQLPENDCKLIKGTGIIIIVVLCAHANV